VAKIGPGRWLDVLICIEIAIFLASSITYRIAPAFLSTPAPESVDAFWRTLWLVPGLDSPLWLLAFDLLFLVSRLLLLLRFRVGRHLLWVSLATAAVYPFGSGAVTYVGAVAGVVAVLLEGVILALAYLPAFTPEFSRAALQVGSAADAVAESDDETVGEEEEVEPILARRGGHFDGLLALALMMHWVWAFFPEALYAWPTSDVIEYYLEQIPAEPRSGWPQIAIHIAWLLLFLRLPVGRWFYVILLTTGSAPGVVFPMTAIGTVLGELGAVLNGVILGLIFVPPLRYQFTRRRTTQPPTAGGNSIWEPPAMVPPLIESPAGELGEDPRGDDPQDLIAPGA